MKPQTLTPAQIEACCKTMPGFARSYADVLRRDAEVAANREAMKGNCTETGANGAAKTTGRQNSHGMTSARSAQ